MSTHQSEAALQLPLSLLRPSPTNPRKRFNQAKLDELADSIQKLGGNFQPILARPNPDYTETNGQPPYEIVAGERRWRASKQAGMPSVLALVRDISDFDAKEIQLVENIDRDDLHPLEEAEGLKALLREPEGLHGYATVEELAQRVSKSRRWVFGRLALLNLCPAAREAFLADEIQASVAGLIARMPDQAQQAEATKRILQGFAGEPFTFRAASDYLAKEFMLALDKAPFDITAPFQVAGPCAQCPKRSGAAPDLFDDVKTGDMCQDSTCFQAKVSEARLAKLDEARAAGHTIVQGVEAHRMVGGSATVLPTGHQWLDKPCPAFTADKRPLREIFGAKQRGAITIEHPHTQALISIVPDASVIKLLKSKGLLRPVAPPPPAARISDAAAEVNTTAPAPAPAAPYTPRTEQQLARAVDEHLGATFGPMLFKQIADALGAAETPPLIILKLAVRQLLNDASHDAYKIVFDTMGWEQPAHCWPSRDDEVLAQQLEGLDGARLAELLAMALCAEDLTEPSLEADDLIDDELPAYILSEAVGIDVLAVERSARDEAVEHVQAEEARLLGTSTATGAFVQAHALSNPKAPVKYRNSVTGETWSGRGLQPKWLKNAISEGARLEDFEANKPALEGAES